MCGCRRHRGLPRDHQPLKHLRQQSVLVTQLALMTTTTTWMRVKLLIFEQEKSVWLSLTLEIHRVYICLHVDVVANTSKVIDNGAVCLVFHHQGLFFRFFPGGENANSELFQVERSENLSAFYLKSTKKHWKPPNPLVVENFRGGREKPISGG